ncbi:tryptophanase [Christensenellaceae bacterium OttesenSCG-928-L17]|nr:tryptophanase [Christensenellaceae bacterium OttesenSCG-928-L17]
MQNIKFFGGEQIPLEMHKVRIVQKLSLAPVEARLSCMQAAGNNTFLLQNKDVFLDMLTDSGVNAMSDNQLAAMMQADDSYAGSMTFTRLSETLSDVFGTEFFLPAHQGRACENILAQAFVRPGHVVPMNYHFTTTKSHITRMGGRVVELVQPCGLETESELPFKGNFDLEKLRETIAKEGAKNIPFIRLEAGTNLIGGQPFSLENATAVCNIARAAGIMTVLDASLLQDNLYFIKTREEACRDMSTHEIVRALAAQVDIVYFSARKLGFARGGGICVHKRALYDAMKEFVTLFEGFLTYGGMSVREMEAIAVGLRETLDMQVISQGPEFIAYMCRELSARGVPVVTPPGGLGCHLNALKFVEHIPQAEYPAGALAAAVYIASGIRGMERGTMSEQRNEDGSEPISDMELLRLAMPRRVFTLSQVKYAVDRIAWLYTHRERIGGLTFVEEPSVLRFFFGRLAPIGNWQEELVAAFKKDFGESL